MNVYLLAGGSSRRMGQSKSRLFLDVVVAAARPAFDEVIAVQRAGAEALAIRSIFDAADAPPAAISGIRSALEDAGGRCFILAVDYPLIRTEVLSWLANRFLQAGAPLLVPIWDGRAQPLCAGYDPAILPLVRRRMEDGRFDLHGLIAEAGGEMIDESELRARFAGEPLRNVNTAEELERLHGEGLFTPR